MGVYGYQAVFKPSLFNMAFYKYVQSQQKSGDQKNMNPVLINLLASLNIFGLL